MPQACFPGPHTQRSKHIPPGYLLQNPRPQTCPSLAKPALWALPWGRVPQLSREAGQEPRSHPSPSPSSPSMPPARVQVTSLHRHLHPSLHHPLNRHNHSHLLLLGSWSHISCSLANLLVLHKTPGRAFQNADLATCGLGPTPLLCEDPICRRTWPSATCQLVCTTPHTPATWSPWLQDGWGIHQATYPVGTDSCKSPLTTMTQW